MSGGQRNRAALNCIRRVATMSAPEASPDPARLVIAAEFCGWVIPTPRNPPPGDPTVTRRPNGEQSPSGSTHRHHQQPVMPAAGARVSSVGGRFIIGVVLSAEETVEETADGAAVAGKKRTGRVPGHRRGGRRPRRWRRRIVRRSAAVVLAVVVLLAVVAAPSLIHALTRPGSDTVAARLAEWGRDHGLGPVVTWLEPGRAQDRPDVASVPRRAAAGSVRPGRWSPARRVPPAGVPPVGGCCSW